MMSFSKVKSAKDADHYFMETDNYYLKSDEFADRFQWWGKGAQKLGLNGKVMGEDFLNVLEGKLPNGEQISAGVNGVRRPGFDLTFSAPKSVSILALIYGKHELLEAHQEAVKKVLKVIEQEAAQARITGKNGTEIEQTGNLIAALFLHDTSRELDAQVHTHAVIPNATERSDGKWRALASNCNKEGSLSKGFYEYVHENQIYLSTIYRATLAEILTNRLHYEIEILPEHEGGKHGMFEIKGFPRELKKAFSKRREQIKALMEREGAISAKGRDILTLNSRRAKQAMDRTELHKIWVKEVKERKPDFDPDSLVKKPGEISVETGSAEPWMASKSAQKNQPTLPSRVQSENPVARQAVIEATQHFAEARLVFTYKDLATKAMQFTMGRASFEEINTAIRALRKEHFLVSLGEDRMSSRDILAYEKSLLSKAESAREKGVPTSVNSKVLGEMRIPFYQKEIVETLLESKEGVSVVNIDLYNKPEGFIEALLNTAEQSGKRVKVLTPTKLYTNELSQKIQRRTFNAWQWVVKVFHKPQVAETVKGYLYRNQESGGLSGFFNKPGRDILVVDSAHRLGNQDLEGLLDVIESKQAKVILLNSEGALKGAAAGTPIALLRRAGIQEYALAQERPEKPKVAITEVLDDTARAQRIASHYAEFDETLQRDTHVLAHTHKQADLLNQEIRRALKNKGSLSHNEYSISTLTPVYLSATERRFASQYLNNMVIKHFKKGGVETYLVLKHIAEDNTVLLLNERQEKVYWNPATARWKTGVYKKGEVEIAEGERLIATDTMRYLGFENGHKLTVKALGKKSTEFLNESTGEILKLNYTQLRDSSIKHAYASTVLGAGREQRGHVIADMKGFAASKEILDEVTTRAAKSIDILTDHEERFIAQAQQVEIKLDASASLMLALKEVPLLQKFIHADTIRDFEKHLTEIAGGLAEAFKGIDSRSLAQKSIDFVVGRLSEREAAFEHKDLITEALIFATTELGLNGGAAVGLSDIKVELERYLAEGKLHASQNKTHWVTQEALECERSLLRLTEEGRGKVPALLSKEEACTHLNESVLTEGQRNAAHLMLTTKDRFIIIQGDPGTGKTALIKKVREILEGVQPGVTLRGLAPTYQAVKELEAVGLQAQTLKSFLVEHSGFAEKAPEDIPDYSKTVFILDEYSMVSNRDSLELTEIITKTGSRMPSFGDIKQFGSIPAGKPMEVQLKAGIASVRMSELVRQKNEEAKDIAKAGIAGNTKEVFRAAEKVNAANYIERDENEMTPAELGRLTASVHEVQKGYFGHEDDFKSNTLRLNEATAREYLLRTPDMRARSPIIVQTHQDRQDINRAIRAGLKQRGELPEVGGLMLKRLIRNDVLKTEIEEAMNVGGYIRLGSQYFEVVEVDRKNRAFLLRGEDGKVTAFDTKRDLLRFKGNYEVFHLQEEELVPGDLVMLRKNDPKRGHKANIDHVVKAIQAGKIQLESTRDQSEVILDSALLKDAHWDYAYTKTSYSMQGASTYYPIIHLSSKDDKLAHVRTLCIVTTRHNHHCMILTDNKARVIERFSRKRDKFSALEVMGELEPKEEAKKEADPLQIGEGAEAVKVQKEEPGHSAHKTIEHFDAKEIEMRLSNQAEMIATHLLGERNTKVGTAGDWRYGKKGSLSVKMSGDKRGSWHNFETGKGGHLLALIQEELGLEFKEALRYAANLVGGSHFETVKRALSPEKVADKKASQADWRQKQIQQLFKEARPIEGTLAERYLKEHRGISALSGLNLSFHPRVYSHKEEKNGKHVYHPALVGFCMDEEGHPCGVHVVYLDENAGKRTDLAVAKRSSGTVGGFPVRVGVGKAEDRISFIAEGVETSASIRESVPHHDVWATLSKENFGKLNPERLSQTVVLCVDNDQANTIKHGQALVKAINRLEQANKRVFIVMPKEGDTDFNDVLKERGRNGVIQEMNNKLSGAAFKERMLHFEAEKKLIDKASSREMKEKALDKIGQKALNALMKAFQKEKTKATPVPRKEIHLQKEKGMHDREIG